VYINKLFRSTIRAPSLTESRPLVLSESSIVHDPWRKPKKNAKSLPSQVSCCGKENKLKVVRKIAKLF
jgi:hypothetical protein